MIGILQFIISNALAVSNEKVKLDPSLGLATIQAVSRRLLTTVTRVRS
jgi:hypothetical protein